MPDAWSTEHDPLIGGWFTWKTIDDEPVIPPGTVALYVTIQFGTDLKSMNNDWSIDSVVSVTFFVFY